MLVSTEQAKAVTDFDREKNRAEYLENILSDYNKIVRQFQEIYEKLYEHSKIKIENALRPIKEWYFQDPEKFDIYDPNLVE